MGMGRLRQQQQLCGSSSSCDPRSHSQLTITIAHRRSSDLQARHQFDVALLPSMLYHPPTTTHLSCPLFTALPLSTLNSQTLSLSPEFIMIISDDKSELSLGETLSLDEIMTVARDIQNRSGRRIGSKVVEDRNFREYFGTSQEVVLILWNFLNEHDLLPEKCDIKHLLWALFFLKV
jgi:hypothetical protein